MIELFGQVGVVVGKVDCLGDLRVGLVQRLTALARGHLHEVRSRLLQLHGNGPQHAGAACPAQTSPRWCGTYSGGEGFVENLGVGDCVRGHRVHAQCGRWDRLDDLTAPLPVARQRRVGVWCVGKLGLRFRLFDEPVLQAVGLRNYLVHVR